MIRWQEKDLILALYVKPNAKKTQIVGVFQNALKIQIAAPAVENKANQYLQRWLAHTFSLPQSHVILEQGQQSRYKIFRIKAPGDIPGIFRNYLMTNKDGI